MTITKIRFSQNSIFVKNRIFAKTVRDRLISSQKMEFSSVTSTFLSTWVDSRDAQVTKVIILVNGQKYANFEHEHKLFMVTNLSQMTNFSSISQRIKYYRDQNSHISVRLQRLPLFVTCTPLLDSVNFH